MPWPVIIRYVICSCAFISGQGHPRDNYGWDSSIISEFHDVHSEFACDWDLVKTRKLARCVESGTFPSTPTIVPGHVPNIPRML